MIPILLNHPAIAVFDEPTEAPRICSPSRTTARGQRVFTFLKLVLPEPLPEVQNGITVLPEKSYSDKKLTIGGGVVPCHIG
jgi:hypothetical protein